MVANTVDPPTEPPLNDGDRIFWRWKRDGRAFKVSTITRYDGDREMIELNNWPEEPQNVLIAEIEWRPYG